MPTREYEYYCGHVRAIRGVRYDSIRTEDTHNFSPHFSFQQSQQVSSNEQDCFPSTRFQDTSAASTLEKIDRQNHARLAGAPTSRRQSIQLNTEIHSPRYKNDRRGSDCIRTARLGQIILSVKKPEKKKDRRYFRNYNCKECRLFTAVEIERYAALERARSAADTERIINGLRPPPCEHQRGTGGNRYRGDDWYELYETQMASRVRFEEGS